MTSIYQKVAVATLGAVISLATFEAIPSHSITFNDAVNGDLPTSFFDSPVFALDLGTNTFTGEVTFSFADNPATDVDSFAFSIPEGTNLESILFDTSLLPGGSGFFTQLGYDLFNFPSTTFIGFATVISSESLIMIPSMNLSLFTSSLPLGSGQFALQNSILAGGLEAGEFQTAAYSFSLNVVATEEVPEPNTLVGLACLGLGGLLLKKKTIA